MNSVPLFPHFKSFEITDRKLIHTALWKYQPETSELTFTNLFMWRKKYKYQWCKYEDWLLFIASCSDGKIYALPPVGPPSRKRAVFLLLDWLSEQTSGEPEIKRADTRLIMELQPSTGFSTESTRTHFDYLYYTTDLINLSGRKYHSKRNHLKQFLKKYTIDYRPVSDTRISECMEFSSRWCKINNCYSEPSLCEEYVAINEALSQFNRLQLCGAAIYINGRMEAFALGELLNNNTAVIHVEKASTEFHGIYAAINQMFCANQFKNTTFINREQDLGNDGLRKAKLSYHPAKLVEKFKIRCKSQV